MKNILKTQILAIFKAKLMNPTVVQEPCKSTCYLSVKITFILPVGMFLRITINSLQGITLMIQRQS